ncbi:type II toxin-antitoxin system VapC family toxin [Achromobacter spanius]|uniref:Ribonuclease VapC n=1 Tax=Achromobacter spanius TaxID=217203 RepID=A0A2S0I6C4_9BURK|nr:type II toxin-antitoxin system VapC family toxin [Achromobacter spanius]AVJ27514.1 VapC toxin family PIN domain ribonuclease [Achromobacter spanius]
MIVLDTNVISEAWKPQPSAQVMQWIDAQNAETLFISAITIAELRLGLAVMPSSKRHDHFCRLLEKELLPAFFGRILPFDLEASGAYSLLMAKARKAGKAISAADGYIAATAATRGMIVASRDTAPFKAADVAVINPWNDV